MRGIQILHIIAIIIIVACIIFYIRKAENEVVKPHAHSSAAQQQAAQAQALQSKIDSLAFISEQQAMISSQLKDSIHHIHAKYKAHHTRVRDADMVELRHILDSLSANYIVNRDRYRLLLDSRIEVAR